MILKKNVELILLKKNLESAETWMEKNSQLGSQLIQPWKATESSVK
jgi:hypothetical protein